MGEERGNYLKVFANRQIPVAVESKAQIRSRFIAGTAGSNPLRAYIFVSCVRCALCGQRPVQRTAHPSRGVPPGTCV